MITAKQAYKITKTQGFKAYMEQCYKRIQHAAESGSYHVMEYGYEDTLEPARKDLERRGFKCFMGTNEMKICWNEVKNVERE